MTAALRVVAEGGNAVDAALAAVLVASVTEPGVVSAAGGAYVTVAPADGSPPVTIDGNVEMPGRDLSPERFGCGVREVTSGYGGGITMSVGHGSVATPGALAALDLANRMYGRAEWADVVAPSVETAWGGFPMGRASHHYLQYVHESVFGTDPESRAALHRPDGSLIGLGEPVHVAGLAETLELIGAEGSATFYGGELARRLVEDMAANGGLITAEDLRSYRAVVRPSLPVTVGAWELATNPAPAVGGVVLAALLTLLGDRPRGPWTANDLAHLVAVQRAVLAQRTMRLDLAEDRVGEAKRFLDLVRDADLARLSGAANTVHVSAVDGDGAACAITCSAGYGSGVTVPGTGLWLNNCLGEHELNRQGLHMAKPGERLVSNMAPTVGRATDGGLLAIGSPGADRITTALAQVLAGVGNAGMGLEAAIAQPRLHVRDAATQPRVDHEEDLALPPLDLPTHAYPSHSMYFGGVAAAMRGADGTLSAAGDPRRTAAVGVSPG